MALRSLPYLHRMLPATVRAMSSQASPAKDWSAAQYLRFGSQRTRPARDLLAQVPLSSPPRRVIDIGCGPGNSTELLAARFPSAQILGIDSSPDMIATASRALPAVQFHVADVTSFASEEPADLLFSNAVLHWIPHDDRIPLIARLVRSLPKGGVFAMQVPDNHAEPSHEAMLDVAQTGPWADMLRKLDPSLGPFQTPEKLYDELKPLCESVDVWRTTYHHPLASHWDIVEWVKGTGLRPFIDPLGDEERDDFLARYHERLRDEYPLAADGGVLLRYPRLFLVAVR